MKFCPLDIFQLFKNVTAIITLWNFSSHIWSIGYRLWTHPYTDIHETKDLKHILGNGCLLSWVGHVTSSGKEDQVFGFKDT